MNPYRKLYWVQGFRLTRSALHAYSYSSEWSHKATEAKYPDNQELVCHPDGMHCAYVRKENGCQFNLYDLDIFNLLRYCP